MVEQAIRKLLLLLPISLRLWRQVNKYVHSFHKLLNNLSPDLVVYPGNDPYVYESKLPGVIPIFDLMHKYESSFPEVSANNINRKRDIHYRNICKYVKAILVDSEIGKEHVIKSYKAEENKIFILPYVPPSYIYRYKGDINIFKEFDLPKRYIFYPAQLWKHKNHIGLIKAISILRKKGVFVNAVFVGSKENASDEIFSKIKELGLRNQIFYLGYVDNEVTISLYKNAVALVMPTFFGPTNIPNLEAFALGCPVVTSNVYGISEQVGDTALLFDPHDVNDIAEKILIAWTNEKLRHQLKEKGYSRSSEWNQEKFNLKLLSIVEKCLDSEH